MNSSPRHQLTSGLTTVLCVLNDRLGRTDLEKLPEQGLQERPPYKLGQQSWALDFDLGHPVLLSEEKSWKLPPQSTKQLSLGYFDILGMC